MLEHTFSNLITELGMVNITVTTDKVTQPFILYWMIKNTTLWVKHDMIWHDMWTSAGQPKKGTLQQIHLYCKAKYKLGIRNAYANFEDKLSEEMCYHFANKNPPVFWKTWHAKFRRNVNKNVNINGYTDNYDIA